MICLWVDDMVIIGTRKNFCDSFKNKVSKKFKIISYGVLSWFLNAKTDKTENKTMLSQDACRENLIEMYKMSDCRTLKTPLGVSSKLSKRFSPKIGSKEYQDMQSFDYRRIVGCLNYLALTTRPGTAHTANILIPFVGNPKNKHRNAAKNAYAT